MLNILICDDEKPFLDRLANKITVYLENREIPVSYTHLDVYKRQVLLQLTYLQRM